MNQKSRLILVSPIENFPKMRVVLCVAALVFVALAKNVERFEFQPLSDEQIDYINNVAKPLWKAGRNFDTDSLQTVIGTLGVDLEANSKYNEKYIRRKEVVVRDDLPKTFDARSKWAVCKSTWEVRDQGACGSCWAFGSVSAMTDRICINGIGQIHLSAEDLLSCCDDCGHGCYGGFPGAAWRFYQTSGLVSGGQYGTKEGCYPYEIPHCDHHVKGKYPQCGDIKPAPKCHKSCEEGYPIPYAKDKYFGNDTYRVQGVDPIAQEIVDNGPVTASFTIYEDFLSYKEGIYEHVVGQPIGGHAVKILGYGVEDGQDYWIVANSWNEDWGDEGFFKIIKGRDECGIESEIIAGLPVKHRHH